MLSTVLHAAAAAAATVSLPVAGDAEPSSLFDTIALKTRSFFTSETNSSIAEMIATAPLLLGPESAQAKVPLLQQLATSASALPSFVPLSTLLPSQSTLLACGLALLLYVASWTALGARGMHLALADDDERRQASFNVKTTQTHKLRQAEAKSGLAVRPPLTVQAMRAVCSMFVFAWQCCVFVWHFTLNRVLCFRTSSVYLRGFTCASMPDDWTVTTERFRRTALQNFGLEDKSVEFCLKLLGRSGLGEQTYFPPGLMSYPPDLSMQAARAEALYIFTNTLDALFASTGVNPKDIDILVVNCSLFAPTPSLAAMIMNAYGMREDVNSYNLSGMGCSAGLVSLHLAKELLQRHPNKLALVFSTELITQQIYTGVETNMLLQNALFRSGGAGILLSNKSSDYAFGRCKYELEHTVRVTMAADNEAYACVFQDEDAKGCRGVRLGKELMGVAGRAMQKNVGKLGPKILPYSEQIKYAANMIARKLDERFRIVDKLTAAGIVAPPQPPTEAELKKLAAKEAAAKAKHEAKQEEVAAKAVAAGRVPKAARPYRAPYRSRIPEYVPNFKTAVQHICIHAGGRAVIDAIQAGLRLSDDDVEASRAMLKRYGNTSSSSIWYEFRHTEQTRDVKRGEKIWQLGFGSGFKSNSAVWRKL